MASDLGHALTIQEHLVGLAEAIRGNGFDRAYMTPDGKGYALACQGDGAKSMNDLMMAVGKYLMDVQIKKGNKDRAKEELLKSFDIWLSTQSLGRK